MKLLATASVVVCLIGCGDESSPDPSPVDTPLTAQERRAADRAVADIRAYCRAVARFLSRGGARPDLAGALSAAELINVTARMKPGATYRGSQTARMLAGDLAEDLEGTNCSPRLAAALVAGL
jgi:hypothetical protein